MPSTYMPAAHNPTSTPMTPAQPRSPVKMMIEAYVYDHGMVTHVVLSEDTAECLGTEIKVDIQYFRQRLDMMLLGSEPQLKTQILRLCRSCDHTINGSLNNRPDSLSKTTEQPFFWSYEAVVLEIEGRTAHARCQDRQDGTGTFARSMPWRLCTIESWNEHECKLSFEGKVVTVPVTGCETGHVQLIPG